MRFAEHHLTDAFAAHMNSPDTSSPAERLTAPSSATPAVEISTEAPEGAPLPLDPWRQRYARLLRMTDFLVLVWVVYGAQLIWFGMGEVDVAVREDSRISDISYWLFSGFLVVAWMTALALVDSRSDRVVGVGTTEYARVVRASLAVFGFIAIGAFLLRVDVARGYLLISLPVGIVCLVLTRWLWRQWLVAQRSMGRYSAKVLLVGSRQSVANIARELNRAPSAGYQVVGACVPSGMVAEQIVVGPGDFIPVMGSVNAVDRAVAATGADTVAVTSTDDLPPNKVKEISWSLESGNHHLVLAPSITDIAGPRIHTRPVSGLPLIHVETPRFTAGQRFAKRMMDLVLSTVLLIALSPVLLAVALTVKLTSPGPVLYRQQRIGLNGHPFGMLKFRSMRVGADAELKKLLEAQGTDTQPLFKIKNDPRITPVGRFIRKYSLDELPQLLNVLGGSMSLVGPRPQIAEEVALYTDAAKRRLLARPGITGLWQVSGRSSTTWEEAVKLDLYYIENWSLIGDFAILAKTAKAILVPGQSAH